MRMPACSDFKVAQVNRPRNHCYYDNRLLRANRNKNCAWSTLNYAHLPCVAVESTCWHLCYLYLRLLYTKALSTTYAGGPTASFHGWVYFFFPFELPPVFPSLNRNFNNVSDAYLGTISGMSDRLSSGQNFDYTSRLWGQR